MDTEDFSVDLNGKRVYVEFNRQGYSVDSDFVLNYREIQVVSGLIFLYIGAKEKGIIISPEYLINRAHDLYNAFYRGRYPLMKSIDEMTTEEFNEEIKKWLS